MTGQNRESSTEFFKLNSFLDSFPIIYPLKTPKELLVFSGVQNGNIDKKKTVNLKNDLKYYY